MHTTPFVLETIGNLNRIVDIRTGKPIADVVFSYATDWQQRTWQENLIRWAIEHPVEPARMKESGQTVTVAASKIATRLG